LFGRLERRSWSTIAGVAYEIDYYRCPGGHGRQVRRPVDLGAAAG
jgi:hypothetical protein